MTLRVERPPVHPHADAVSFSDADFCSTAADSCGETVAEALGSFFHKFEMQCSEDRSATDRLQHALQTMGYPELRKLDCEVIRGIAILRGSVSSFYLKQIAQSAALQLPSISGVRNLIRTNLR